MLYVIALIVLLAAVLLIYLYRVVASFIAAHRAHRAARRDPEAQGGEIEPRPTFRQVAREVTHTMFPPRQQEPHVPAHRRSSQEMARASWSTGVTAVNRVETRDGDLPSYQDSANMPKLPAAIYSASTANPTAARMEAEQVSLPGYGVPSPPQYQEQPVVR